MPVTRDILLGGAGVRGAAVFAGLHQLEAHRRAADAVWSAIDVLVVPTVAAVPTLAEVEANPVAAREAELSEFRAAFPRGRARVVIEPTSFGMTRYRAFLAEHRESIEAWKRRQQSAFDGERERGTSFPRRPAPEGETRTG